MDMVAEVPSKNKMPNEPMDPIPMPSALLSHILLTQDLRQKQVVMRHRGRSRSEQNLAFRKT